MDQFKEYLNQAIKYRFWIAVGVACLLPLIAYFAGTGGIAEEAKKEKTKIEASNNEVKNYINGQIYNKTWKDVVDQKTGIVTKDVDSSWRKLYLRQAPLLTWPKEVEDTIPIWGPKKWPEGVDSAKVNLVVNDYLQVYPAYVDEVYKSFSPFNPEDGTGIVASPSKDLLLKPAVFDETNPPSLGKVWNAQRKLWVERTMLDIVKKVNEKAKAKNWDEAPIKQILDLEVASPQAQDQKSVAKAEALKEPDDIVDPRAPVVAKSTTSSAPSSSAFGAPGGSSAATSSTFQYISSTASDNQFITVPVAMKVYIDQERIPDLLVEFQNSPMDIKVKDFELKPPSTPVQKPVKGVDQSVFGGLGGFLGGRGRGGDAGLLGGAGGSTEFGPANRGGLRPPGYPGANSNGSAGFERGGGGTNYPGNGAATTKGAVNKSEETLDRIREKKKSESSKKSDDEPEKKDAPEATVSNPYFNVVEVTIKGQARFYVAPPPLPAPEASSPGSAPAEPPKAAPAPEAPKADAAKTAEPPKDAPKTDAPKAEAGKAEPAKDAAKPADPKAAAAPDASKDTPKTDTPKTDTPKTDAPKDAPPKADDVKAPDAPKADADKPKDTPK